MAIPPCGKVIGFKKPFNRARGGLRKRILLHLPKIGYRAQDCFQPVALSLIMYVCVRVPPNNANGSIPDPNIASTLNPTNCCQTSENAASWHIGSLEETHLQPGNWAGLVERLNLNVPAPALVPSHLIRREWQPPEDQTRRTRDWPKPVVVTEVAQGLGITVGEGCQPREWTVIATVTASDKYPLPVVG
jgi:hypothetical protein